MSGAGEQDVLGGETRQVVPRIRPSSTYPVRIMPLPICRFSITVPRGAWAGWKPCRGWGSESTGGNGAVVEGVGAGRLPFLPSIWKEASGMPLTTPPAPP